MNILKLFQNKISEPSHFKKMISDGAKMTRCGWCGKETPVWQPMSIDGDSGTTCHWCERTVDDYYRDWTYRAEYKNGCVHMRFLYGGGYWLGACHEAEKNNEVPVKEWRRSNEDAKPFSAPEVDFENVLKKFPEEFQVFFCDVLDALGTREIYFSGKEYSLSHTRWHWEKLPQWAYENFKDGKFAHAITIIQRELAKQDEKHWPFNPFLSSRERNIIFDIARMVMDDKKNANHQMQSKIQNLAFLSSEYKPNEERDDEKYLPSKKIMSVYNKYKGNCDNQ